MKFLMGLFIMISKLFQLAKSSPVRSVHKSRLID